MTVLLALDQGTTSSRAIVFDADGTRLAMGSRPLPAAYPQPGWVEQDPEHLWDGTLHAAREALAAAKAGPGDVAAVGVTNQRETTLLWERATGRPLAPAIVWQDRRTAETCERLAAEGAGDLVTERTGLLLDPYFSATKLAWLLDRVPGARAAAEAGELAFGTVDTFLLWRLSQGERHVTDATNASRTMLFDIHRQVWDEDLLATFGIPAAVLPEVLDSAGPFATCARDHFGGALEVTGVAGDQQAAAFGQACFRPGMIKSTYGTGCFVLLHTGGDVVTSRSRLLATVGYRLDGATSYAVEGSIFSAGSVVQWMRDELRLFERAEQTAEMARASDPARRVYLVPAFTGLGAPYWDPHARGALIGLTRDTSADDVVRAGLESVGWQTADLLDAMVADGAARPATLRVDGGMVVNDWVAQFLADSTGVPVERPVVTETTALGAASLAGLGAGLVGSLDELAGRWKLERRFEPSISEDERKAGHAGWARAVERVRGD